MPPWISTTRWFQHSHSSLTLIWGFCLPLTRSSFSATEENKPCVMLIWYHHWESNSRISANSSPSSRELTHSSLLLLWCAARTTHGWIIKNKKKQQQKNSTGHHILLLLVYRRRGANTGIGRGRRAFCIFKRTLLLADGSNIIYAIVPGISFVQGIALSHSLVAEADDGGSVFLRPLMLAMIHDSDTEPRDSTHGTYIYGVR